MFRSRDSGVYDNNVDIEVEGERTEGSAWWGGGGNEGVRKEGGGGRHARTNTVNAALHLTTSCGDDDASEKEIFFVFIESIVVIYANVDKWFQLPEHSTRR